MKNPLLRLHGIVFLWGFTAILGKLIEAPAQNLVFYRMGLASLFLWVFIRLISGHSIVVPRRLLYQLFGTGVCMALHWLCFFYSIKVSNVSVALCCLSTSTLFASIIEPIVYRRKADWTELLVGVIILVCVSLIFNVELEYKTGIFFGLLCAFLGTLFSVFNGKFFGKTSSENIIFYEIFGGFVFLTLYFLVRGELGTIATVSMKDFFWLVLLASVFTAFPMLESVKLMKYFSPFTLVLTVNLEPVYGIFFAFFIFGQSEQMSLMFYIAVAVMILSIAFNGYMKAKRKSAQNNSV